MFMLTLISSTWHIEYIDKHVSYDKKVQGILVK